MELNIRQVRALLKVMSVPLEDMRFAAAFIKDKRLFASYRHMLAAIDLDAPISNRRIERIEFARWLCCAEQFDVGAYNPYGERVWELTENLIAGFDHVPLSEEDEKIIDMSTSYLSKERCDRASIAFNPEFYATMNELLDVSGWDYSVKLEFAKDIEVVYVAREETAVLRGTFLFTAMKSVTL
ncbi:MAG: hypothetical protein LBP28_05700 [Coriobacteriales bacterium]|jgi:hypothetical protein|nr:hypothetical protein [Coriobacteriales bacterium]